MTSYRYLTRLALLGFGALLLAGCSLLTTWEPGVVIPPEHYRIDNLRCEPKPGKTFVDGEDVDDLHWFVRGDFVNLLDTGSPNYEVQIRVVFDDGTIKNPSTLVFPLAPGDVGDFSGFIETQVDLANDDTTVVECSEVVVYDSVLNHG